MPTSMLHISRFWMLQLGGWTAFAVAMTFSRVGIYPLSYMLVDKGILTALGVALTLGLRFFYRRLRRRDLPLPLLLLLIAATSYLVSMPWTAAHNLAMGAHVASLRGDEFVVASWFQLLGGTVYHAFVLMAWSVLYFGITYYDDLQQQRERAVRAEAHAQRARLEALRYQIHPHFLFNTLNAVSTLVAEGDTRSAGRMISRLSDFLRLTLDEDVAQEVPLAEELDFVKQYLDIEQIRFGERLRTRIDVEPEALSALVPSLILQPLVENAVRHGISAREEGGAVVVIAHVSGEMLRLRVTDDSRAAAAGAETPRRTKPRASATYGRSASPITRASAGLPPSATSAPSGTPPSADSPPSGTPPSGADRPGIGLANTRSRLRELYGDDHALTIRRADGGGMEVVIELPFRKIVIPSVSSTEVEP